MKMCDEMKTIGGNEGKENVAKLGARLREGNGQFGGIGGGEAA